MPDLLGKLDTLYTPVYLQLLHVGAYANSWLVLWFIQHFLLKLCITLMLQWWWCWSAFVFSNELPFIIIIRGGICTCIVMLKEQVIMTDATSEFHCPVMNYNKESRWKGCGRYGQVWTVEFFFACLFTFNKIIPGHVHQMLNVVCEEQVSSLWACILL